MAYQYSFDRTSVGNWIWFESSFRILLESFRLLRDEVAKWNQRAIEHGAARKPYEKEESELTQYLSWGEERLRQSRDHIEINGVTVGTKRYEKAAFLYNVHLKGIELSEMKSQGWPGAVITSLQESISSIQSLADKINQEPAEILWELIPKESSKADYDMSWDLFISHASEDKDEFVRPLVAELEQQSLKVWYDDFTLTVGDSLRRSIDRGLAHSRYGVVVISPHFLKKEWPQKELDGLFALEVNGRKVVLPVWHKVSATDVRKFSPMLADRVATSSNKGVNQVAADLLAAIR